MSNFAVSCQFSLLEKVRSAKPLTNDCQLKNNSTLLCACGKNQVLLNNNNALRQFSATQELQNKLIGAQNKFQIDSYFSYKSGSSFSINLRSAFFYEEQFLLQTIFRCRSTVCSKNFPSNQIQVL